MKNLKKATILGAIMLMSMFTISNVNAYEDTDIEDSNIIDTTDIDDKVYISVTPDKEIYAPNDNMIFKVNIRNDSDYKMVNNGANWANASGYVGMSVHVLDSKPIDFGTIIDDIEAHSSKTITLTAQLNVPDLSLEVPKSILLSSIYAIENDMINNVYSETTVGYFLNNIQLQSEDAANFKMSIQREGIELNENDLIKANDELVVSYKDEFVKSYKINTTNFKVTSDVYAISGNKIENVEKNITVSEFYKNIKLYSLNNDYSMKLYRDSEELSDKDMIMNEDVLKVFDKDGKEIAVYTLHIVDDNMQGNVNTPTNNDNSIIKPTGEEQNEHFSSITILCILVTGTIGIVVLARKNPKLTKHIGVFALCASITSLGFVSKAYAKDIYRKNILVSTHYQVSEEYEVNEADLFLIIYMFEFEK